MYWLHIRGAEWVYGLCSMGGVACVACEWTGYLPVEAAVIYTLKMWTIDYVLHSQQTVKNGD